MPEPMKVAIRAPILMSPTSLAFGTPSICSYQRLIVSTKSSMSARRFIAAGLIRTDRAKGGWATFTECIHGAPSEGRDAMWGTFGMTVVFVVGAIVAHRRLEP